MDSLLRNLGVHMSSRPKQRITDAVANQVQELAQTTNNITQISRVCRISRGAVNKILKNKPQ